MTNSAMKFITMDKYSFCVMDATKTGVCNTIFYFHILLQIDSIDNVLKGEGTAADYSGKASIRPGQTLSKEFLQKEK